MANIHERFDLKHWLGEFSLDRIRAENQREVEQAARDFPEEFPDEAEIRSRVRNLEPHAGMLHGPKELCIIEQLRAQIGPQTLGPAVPADVFVWGLGEPANRAATKIGGVPYRPANLPWPTRDGRPLGLLAQFCFADSHDIARVPGGLLSKPRPLPGDVLLIFAPGDYLVDWDDDEQKSLRFEWHPLGLTDLVRPENVPPPPVPLAPAYAQIHRTADYPRPPEGHAVYEDYHGRELCILKGSKIGGVPAWEQGERNVPGTYLCTLGSLNPFGQRYPLLNVERSPGGMWPHGHHLLKLADLGQMYLFIDKKGELRWLVQFG